MMLTEAEAREKLCPIRADNDTCFASGCMAWRVGVPSVPAYPGDKEITSYVRGRVATTHIILGTERPAQPEKGFCGQFGRPA